MFHLLPVMVREVNAPEACGFVCRTISGPVIGALIIEPGQLYLTIKYTNGYLSEILLGALFLLIVLFVPRGIVPTAGEWLRRLRTRGRPAVPPVPTAPDPDPARSGLSGGAR